MKNQDRTQCIQCATCCRKGGPALHKEDAHLVRTGKILCKHLVTIRKGEPAFDNIKNRFVSMATDIIKIKNKTHSRSCIFLDDKNNACAIYAIRPFECKILQCWNTTSIENHYDRDRLTREDLLSETKDMWDLIVDHQKQCDYNRIRKLIDDAKEFNKSRIDKVRFLVRYDTHLRSLLSEKGGIDEDMMDFLLGQPLTVTVQRLGIAPLSKQRSSI